MALSDDEVRQRLARLRGNLAPVATPPFVDRCEWRMEQRQGDAQKALVLRVESAFASDLVKGLTTRRAVNLGDVIKAIGNKAPPGYLLDPARPRYARAVLSSARLIGEHGAELRFEEIAW